MNPPSHPSTLLIVFLCNTVLVPSLGWNITTRRVSRYHQNSIQITHLSYLGSGGCATVLQQSIGVSSETSGFEGVDGILGLGPEDLTAGTVENTQQVPTIMQGSVRDLQIPANILGVYFKPGASGVRQRLSIVCMVGSLFFRL
jgi:hypothetical protein